MHIGRQIDFMIALSMCRMMMMNVVHPSVVIFLSWGDVFTGEFKV